MKKDIVGNVYGRLTVLKEVEPRKGNRYFDCECSCIEHNHVIVPYSNLTSGNTRSCGCLKAENELVGRPKLGNKYRHMADGKTIVFHADTKEEDLRKFDFENKSLPYLTIISTEWFDLVKDYTITHVDSNNTTYIYVEGQVLILYRYLMNCPKGMTVDHINHDRRDNTKGNLRICTQAENNKNTVLFINSITGEQWNYEQELRRAGINRDDFLPVNIADIPKEQIQTHLRSICTSDQDPATWIDDYRKYDNDYERWYTNYETYIEEHKDVLSDGVYADWVKKRKTSFKYRTKYARKLYEATKLLVGLPDEEAIAM